jgi:hypothetical protein
MPASRNEQQIVERAKKSLGPAGLTNEALPFRAADLSLRRTFVAISEKRSEVRPQVQPMRTVGMCGAAKGRRAKKVVCCANLDVTQSLSMERSLNGG